MIYKIPPPPPPSAAKKLIDFFPISGDYQINNIPLTYVTKATRQEIFVKYGNRLTRDFKYYEFEWENMGGGVWKIIGVHPVQ